MSNGLKRKTIPRQAATVRANLERFPLDNPIVRAALCRIMDTALAKIIAEDTENRLPIGRISNHKLVAAELIATYLQFQSSDKVGQIERTQLCDA